MTVTCTVQGLCGSFSQQNILKKRGESPQRRNSTNIRPFTSIKPNLTIWDAYSLPVEGIFFFFNPFSSDRYQLLPCLLVEAFRQLARDWIDSMCLVFWRKPTFVSERDNNRSASEVAGASNRKSDKRGLMCLLAAGCGSMTTPIGCVIAGQHVN